MLFDVGYLAHDFKSPRSGYRGTSLQAFFSAFPTDEDCLRHVFQVRYGLSPACSNCNKSGKWYRINGTKRFQHPCGKAIWPLSQTLFHATHLPLKLWFYAFLHFANSAEGVNSAFLARHLGISGKAAFRMSQLIRIHLAAQEQTRRLGSPGKPVHVRIERLRGVRARSKKRRGIANVLFIADQFSVQSTVIEKPRRDIIKKILLQKTVEGSIPITNCYHTFRTSSHSGTRSPVTEFVPSYFLNNADERDVISGFLFYFRAPLHFHHRRVDKGNLWKYLKEYEFRFNRRSQSERTYWEMLSRFPTLTPESIDDLMRWNSQLAQ